MPRQEQFGEDSRGAPGRVVAAHAVDQIADLVINFWPAALLPGLPSPIQPENDLFRPGKAARSSIIVPSLSMKTAGRAMVIPCRPG
jgi:hypothetical protein